MRIAVVINTSWNIYNFRQGLIKGLLDEGHTVFAIAPNDDYSKKLESLGVEYIPLEMHAKGMNPFKDFQLMKQFRALYKRHEIDVALHYTIKPNLYGSWACKSIDTYVVNNVSGLGTTFIRDNWLMKLVKRLYRYCFKYSQHVFFQNPEDRDLFLSYKLVDEKKTGLLPGSGIRFKEIGFKPKDVDNEKIKILFPARVLIDKGIREYLEVATRIKKEFGDKIEFLVCGKPEPNPKLGLDHAELESYVKKGVINYLGNIDNMLEQMEEVDCIVLPSYREGTPRVLLEASCVGRFIITTDTVGCREVVKNEMNGLLCDVKDADSLYNCVLQFLEMPNSIRQGMVEKGRKLVEEKFDEQIVIDRYNNILNNLR